METSILQTHRFQLVKNRKQFCFRVLCILSQSVIAEETTRSVMREDFAPRLWRFYIKFNFLDPYVIFIWVRWTRDRIWIFIEFLGSQRVKPSLFIWLAINEGFVSFNSTKTKSSKIFHLISLRVGNIYCFVVLNNSVSGRVGCLGPFIAVWKS